MIAVQCTAGHLPEVDENDVAVHKCCCGFLEPDECPTCQETLITGAGIDLARPGGIPQPDLWDSIMSKGEVNVAQ